MNSSAKKNHLLAAGLFCLALGTGRIANAQTRPTDSSKDSVARWEANPALPPLPPPGPENPDRRSRPVPSDRPGAPDPSKRGPEGGHRESVRPVNTFSGTVSSLLSNNDLVYDGFILKTSTDSFQVHFPPFMGQTVRKSLKLGQTVKVEGVRNTTPPGENVIELLALTAGGNRVEVTPPPTPTPVAATYSKGSGKIINLTTDREGMVNALVLDDKRILRLPPAVFQGLPQAPVIGNTVSYTGTTRELPTGEWLQSDLSVIRVKTITINGQQYLVGPR